MSGRWVFVVYGADINGVSRQNLSAVCDAALLDGYPDPEVPIAVKRELLCRGLFVRRNARWSLGPQAELLDGPCLAAILPRVSEVALRFAEKVRAFYGKLSSVERELSRNPEDENSGSLRHIVVAGMLTDLAVRSVMADFSEAGQESSRTSSLWILPGDSVASHGMNVRIWSGPQFVACALSYRSLRRNPGMNLRPEQLALLGSIQRGLPVPRDSAEWFSLLRYLGLVTGSTSLCSVNVPVLDGRSPVLGLVQTMAATVVDELLLPVLDQYRTANHDAGRSLGIFRRLLLDYSIDALFRENLLPRCPECVPARWGVWLMDRDAALTMLGPEEGWALCCPA